VHLPKSARSSEKGRVFDLAPRALTARQPEERPSDSFCAIVACGITRMPLARRWAPRLGKERDLMRTRLAGAANTSLVIVNTS